MSAPEQGTSEVPPDDVVAAGGGGGAACESAKVSLETTEEQEKIYGHLNQLQGTSEPFASALWKFWISEIGPGHLESKVLKVCALYDRFSLLQCDRQNVPSICTSI